MDISPADESNRMTAEAQNGRRAGPERGFVGYGAKPPAVHWPDGRSVALSIVVNYEEGAESSFDEHGVSEPSGEIGSAIGPEYRDLASETSWEYGSRAGIWRLLRLFREFSAPVTFFACARALERNPAVAAALVEDGHEPASHGWGFDRHWLFSRDEERERIRRAVASITASCGRRPVGSYFPFGPSASTRELLVEEGGFVYDSDAYNDDLPYTVEVQGREHLVVPYSAVYNDSRFLSAPGFSSPHDFFQLCKAGLDQLTREAREGYPKMMSIGIHPKTIGQAGRVVALRQVLEYVTERGDVWVARREDIARWWLEHRHTWGC
jgi:peptidoglycan/xylan/chitin deacetylase (PgdA/CDA1 family)